MRVSSLLYNIGGGNSVLCTANVMHVVPETENSKCRVNEVVILLLLSYMCWDFDITL